LRLRCPAPSGNMDGPDFPKKISDDPHGAAVLIRRLIMEQAGGLLAGVTWTALRADGGPRRGATAAFAYILGQVINQGLCRQERPRQSRCCRPWTVALFIVKGASTYGH